MLCRCCMDAHTFTHAVTNVSLMAIRELRHQDVFVAHLGIQLIRLLYLHVDMCVVVSEGKSSVFLIITIFFTCCLSTHFFVFWPHIKGTKNISDDSDTSGKVKRGILLISFLFYD